VGKHSPPNSKASIRRQHDEEVRQEYLNWNENRNKQPEQLEYDYGDALLDDLMGNTAELTSTPTPEPVYLGHKHEKFYAKVKDQMERYKRLQVKQEDGSLVHITALPSDQDISLLVRSFRDRNGTKLKPVGIVKALEHVLKDVQLPISSFGEKTYNALLTCTASPKEARRIFRLMQENQITPTSYSWSILVDVHSKTGDFLGCDKVMREMLVEGVKPTLPAYTSLLAACYKVCNSGTIPKSVRAEAGQLGWSKWKEMRILGVDPDVMAYGAMLRLCAARGQAERALNLLEEMQHMEVKPTTLCFTAALKAIARSHQIAIRFENGTSKRYRRRQYVTAHHGKMTREVVLLAERAEVELDDGFIAALMLCAGTAGDSATAKAILLAREVRKLDHLRTIGSNRHLKRLQGINDHEDSSKTIEAKLSQLFLNGNEEAAETLVDNALKELSLIGGSPLDLAHANENESLSFAEREYGKDSRVLSALMHACSQALASSGLGDMWEGRDNKGYLCEISLRMLTVKPEPTYRDNSIPGVDPTIVGLGSLKWDEEEPEHMSKRLRRAKFQGVEIDEESGTNMDDLDPYFYQMFKDDDPALKRGNPDATVEELPADDAAWDLSSRMPQNLRIEEKAENPELPTEEWYFDMDDSRWKTRLVEAKKEGNVRSTHIGLGSQMSPVHKEIMEQDTISAQHDEEWYFDQDESKWKTRSRGPATLVSGERQKIDVMVSFPLKHFVGHVPTFPRILHVTSRTSSTSSYGIEARVD
jgi:pentatricopeptide repeat protein